MSKIELDHAQRQRVESVLEWMSDFPDEAAAELIYLRDRVKVCEPQPVTSKVQKGEWISHELRIVCPVHPMDMVEVWFTDVCIGTDYADMWDWGGGGITYYRQLLDGDGVPFVSGHLLEYWAEYVATDAMGDVFQYTHCPSAEEHGEWTPSIVSTNELERVDNRYANTTDHWTDTLRRVWREENDRE